VNPTLTRFEVALLATVVATAISLAYMMLDADADVVAVSAAMVYRVLSAADLLGRKTSKTKTKGKGFNQPDAPHQRWHAGVSYINICGTFFG